MNVEVVRHHFFNARPSPTLRWTERSPAPAEPECDHAVCGCTRTVTTRPEGDPESTNSTVVLTTTRKDRYDVKLAFNGETAWFTILESKKPSSTHDGRTERHYFIFSEGSIQVQITGTGDGYRGIPRLSDIDCLLGVARFGGVMDLSRLYNGHSRSQLVDSIPLGPDDLWVYDSTYGYEESIEFLTPVHAETIGWWDVHRMLVAAIGEVRSINYPLSSTDDVRAAVEADVWLRCLFSKATDFLVRIVDDPAASEMVRAVRQVRRTIGKP